MAKRRKPAAAAPEAPQETESTSPTRPTISEKKLKALMRAKVNNKKEVAALTGAFREKIGNAVENDHLHPKAFNIATQLDAMSDEKLAECLDYLDHYLDAGGLRERAAKVLSMDFEGDEEGDDEDEESNVRPFAQPRGIAAE